MDERLPPFSFFFKGGEDLGDSSSSFFFFFFVGGEATFSFFGDLTFLGPEEGLEGRVADLALKGGGAFSLFSFLREVLQEDISCTYFLLLQSHEDI